MQNAPLQFNRSLMLVVAKRLALVILICLIGGLPAFPQSKPETLNGYAEFYKDGFLIVEGQRVFANQSTKFKKITALGMVPLGAEVKVKAIRQSDGSMLAVEVEPKPNGVAMFEPEAWSGANEVEKFWVNNGMKLVQMADGTWRSQGRIISEGPQVARVQNIMARLLPPYVAPNRLRVRVIENEEWNAAAMTNGAVWVHTSLLRDMSDDELAVILGHELAHFTHEHIRRQMKTQMWIDMAAAAAQSATTNIQAQQYISLGLSAWKNGYSREHEDQADRVGLRYTYEGGFDVVRGHRIWARFLEKYGESDKLTNLLYGSHSRPSERLGNLQTELERNYRSASARPASAVSEISRRPVSPSSADITVPFAGLYTGEWVAKLAEGADHTGTWVISIAANGEVSGTEHDKTSVQKGNIKGFIAADGSIELLLTYSGETGTVKGTLTKSGDQLTGLLRQYAGSKTVAIIDMVLKRE